MIEWYLSSVRPAVDCPNNHLHLLWFCIPDFQIICIEELLDVYGIDLAESHVRRLNELPINQML